MESRAVGGIPVGCILVHGPTGTIISKGRNQRVQKHSNILHGETDCFENAGVSFKGRLVPWKESICVTSLSPCFMCTGAILKFGIPMVIVADSSSASADGEELLISKGVQVIGCNDDRCISMMSGWIKENPGVWTGEVPGLTDGAWTGNS